MSSNEGIDSNGGTEGKMAAESKSKSLPERAKALWTKTGITWHVYTLMFKGALAPTIAMSAYQATAWAEQYTTIGYLVGIITILSIVIQPRAKFCQSMLIQILLVCFTAAVSTLACFCCVKARMSSTASNGSGTGASRTSGLAGGGAQTAPYSGSASAVAGVWLFVQVFFISVLRARLPQYAIPCIMSAIIVNIAMVYAPQFDTMAVATDFIVALLTAYLTAFAIATGVSLVVFPLTSRHLVRNDMTSFISSLRSTLKAHMVYLNSLQADDTDMFAAQRTNTAGEKPFASPEARNFAAKMEGLSGTLAKFSTNLAFAKREVAVGRLGPDDLQKIFRLMREIVIPAVGLSCMPAIFEHTSEDAGWDRSVSFANVSLAEAANDSEKARIEAINEWHELLRLLQQPFSNMTDVLDAGLEHVLLTLNLLKPQKKVTTFQEEETAGDVPRPGDANFSQYYRQRANEFQKSKRLMLQGFCHVHDIELPDDFFDDASRHNFEAPSWMNESTFSPARRALRRQLMIVLYIEFLLGSVSNRVFNLIEFAESLKDSGKLGQRRLIVPGLKRVRKWIYSSLFQEQDVDADDNTDIIGTYTDVRLGDAFRKRRDPEHLPPQGVWERFTNGFRNIAHFFNSPASKFGFRVAVATMAIAIISYLKTTQIFFTQERLFWAQIMTSIAMSPSAGQSLRAFILRTFGTFISMILSYIAYYIVDGKTAGVLVFYFIFLHFGMWIVISRPPQAPVGIIAQVTMTLILGYELQVRKIGIQKAESNGQVYHPIWLLGLIRLATVVAGLFNAWCWTIFPYPITEHSQFRKNFGSALYLLANYYSVVHETVQLRLKGIQSDMEDKHSPGRQLEKVRHKIFSKCHVIISGLRAQSGFIKYDIPVGGKFPVQQYQDLLVELQNVLNFMALISVASLPFYELNREGEKDHGLEWLTSFRRVIGEAKLTSQSVTTLLSLLSSSITNGNPLPPYLRVPAPYQLSEKLDKLDKDILSIRHIAEPGYASFSVIQLGTKSLLDDLQKLLDGVRELVGELDFSFQVTSMSDKRKEDHEETLTYTTSRTNAQKGGKTD